MSTGVHYQVQMFDDENYSVFSPQFQVKAASIQENKDPESYTVSKLVSRHPRIISPSIEAIQKKYLRAIVDDV